MKKLNKKGMTLIEVLMSVAILTIVFAVILLSNMFCLNLNATTRNYSLAIDEAKNVMEQIRAHQDYNDMIPTYHNIDWLLPGSPNILGHSYVEFNKDFIQAGDPKELKVTVSVCWKENDGRIIGECKVDQNGNFVVGPDSNGNGIMDSPIELLSYISQR